jgi:hypothetical protein
MDKSSCFRGSALFRLANLHHRPYVVHPRPDCGRKQFSPTECSAHTNIHFQITAVQFGAGIWTGVLIVRAGRFSLLNFDRLKPPVVRRFTSS